MALNRLTKELKTLHSHPISGISAGAIGSDVFHWWASIGGPQGSPYAGGLFSLQLLFPSDFPFAPPKVHFIGKVYHPNVSQADGSICLDVLRNGWNPALNVRTLLNAISELLAHPNPEDALEIDLANQLETNPELFNTTAREWTQKYAAATEKQNYAPLSKTTESKSEQIPMVLSKTEESKSKSELELESESESEGDKKIPMVLAGMEVRSPRKKPKHERAKR